MVGCGLAGITILSWIYLVSIVGTMKASAVVPLAMHHASHRATHDLLALAVMWGVMMIAMMVPAVTPTVLMFARLDRTRRGSHAPYRGTTAFAGGYLVLWCAASILAALGQHTLQSRGLMSADMALTSDVLGGLLLVAAGAFQWTPLKDACLSHCRSPLAFFMTRWKDGVAGAFRMGIEHGGYCIGCCWLLMLLLFLAGAMNLLWMAAITGLVLIEKLAAAGPWFARVSGALLAGWGAVLLVLALRHP